MQEAHLFWVMIFVAILVGVFAIRMNSYGLIRWRTLKDIQAVPIASPAFAFSAPYLFSKSLIVDNIPEHARLVHQSLFFGSGSIFILYLIGFYFLKAKMESSSETISLIEGIEPAKQSQNFLKILFGLFAVGIFLILVPVLDLILVNQFL